MKTTAESFEQLRHDLRRLRNSALRQTRKDLRSLHRAAERKTGFLFGYAKVNGWSTSGYPLHESLLTICPPIRNEYGRFFGAVSVKQHVVYLGRPLGPGEEWA